MRTRSVVLLAAATLVGFGCASHPPPTDHMASAVAAVRGAQVAVAQAGQVPEADLHLRLAQEQVTQARQMMDRGDNERADYMTLRAYNDAELALALAREHQAREAADAAKRGIPSATTEPTEPNLMQPDMQPDVAPDDAAPQSSDPHAAPGPSQ